MPTPPDVELLNGSLPEPFVPEQPVLHESEPDSDSESEHSSQNEQHSPLVEAPAAEPVEQSNVSTFNVRSLTQDLVTFKVWSTGPEGEDHEVHIWGEGQPLTLTLESLRAVVEDMAESVDPNAVVDQVVDELEALADARSKELTDLSNRVLFGMMIFFFITTFTAIFSELNRSTK